MGNDFYLCGCNVKEKATYTYAKGPKGELLPIKDSEGFLICPEHSVRQRNWITDFRHHDDKPTNIKYDGPDMRDNRDPEEVYLELVAARSAPTNGHH